MIKFTCDACGACFPVTQELIGISEQHEKLCEAVRNVRDQRGDDRCWKDWEAVYALLPEGYAPPERDESVELENCRAYVRSCHDPAVSYVSPQRRIEELEGQIAELRRRLGG